MKNIRDVGNKQFSIYLSSTNGENIKLIFVMMLSRNDCVLKTSGNFKITSLVPHYSFSIPPQPIISEAPLGIVPLLAHNHGSLLWGRPYTMDDYFSIFYPFILHFFLCSLFTLAGDPRVLSTGLLLSLCDVTPEPEPGAELPTPAWSETGAGGRGPREDNGITRLNNVRIMVLKPRLSMGSLGSHNCQTTRISAFSIPCLASPRPASALFSLLYSPHNKM